LLSDKSHHHQTKGHKRTIQSGATDNWTFRGSEVFFINQPGKESNPGPAFVELERSWSFKPILFEFLVSFLFFFFFPTIGESLSLLLEYCQLQASARFFIFFVIFFFGCPI